MCIDALQAQFPESSRVQKLLGIKFEAQEKYDIALEIYQEIKEAEPTNAVSLEFSEGQKKSSV